MKRRDVKIYHFLMLAIMLLLVVVGFSGCNVSGISPGRASVLLSLGNLKAVGVSSVTVTVTGPDMEDITTTYTSSTPSNSTWTLTLEVPSGADRKFEVSADVTDSVNAILSYYGSAEEPVIDENHTTVDIYMGISRMKIITTNPYVPFSPGPGEVPSITVMDDMKGTNWKRITNTDLGWTVGVFQPWDVDVDQYGNIILVSNDGGTPSGALGRIASLSVPVYTPLQSGAIPFVSVAVDRENSKIYYASASGLYRCDYDGSNVETLSGTFGDIKGIALDDDGMLYLVDNEATDKIEKYDPETESVVKTGSITSNLLEDIMVKGDYVYVADGYNKQIVKLNKSDLSIVATYNDGGNLYGPRRFVATLNSGIYFADESDISANARLVYIDDINGNGYTEFGSYGYGINQFVFYYP